MPRAAAASAKPARQPTSFAHLLNAPRAALDRMTDRSTSVDSWETVHARAIGDGGASDRSTAKSAGDGWDAAAKRTGAGR